MAPIGTLQTGETAGRVASARYGGSVATTTALAAVPANKRSDGQLWHVAADDSLWRYSLSSTATASDDCVAPAAGNGRFVRAGSGASGLTHTITVRNRTSAALGAYTRTGNVILANANGAIGAIDGVTNIVGDLVFLHPAQAAAGADAGVYIVDAVGGAGAKYQLTRAPGADTAAELIGATIRVTAGAAYGDTSYQVTNDSITLNTTAITVRQTVSRYGMPMQNILRLLGAPGAAVEGNTVTIGANVFEFRASTPPAGGTAGRIWVYNGANSAASRANLIKAINGVVEAAVVTYDGALTETFLAAAGITTGDILIQSASAAGGTPVPSATATACAETLATATDIWDNATCQYGRVQSANNVAMVTATVGAEELARGTLDVTFPFTPTSCILVNRSRPQNEAYTISTKTVSLTLAGGAAPNNQSGDVIDVIAFE